MSTKGPKPRPRLHVTNFLFSWFDSSVPLLNVFLKPSAHVKISVFIQCGVSHRKRLRAGKQKLSALNNIQCVAQYVSLSNNCYHELFFVSFYSVISLPTVVHSWLWRQIWFGSEIRFAFAWHGFACLNITNDDANVCHIVNDTNDTLKFDWTRASSVGHICTDPCSISKSNCISMSSLSNINLNIIYTCQKSDLGWHSEHSPIRLGGTNNNKTTIKALWPNMPNMLWNLGIFNKEVELFSFLVCFGIPDSWMCTIVMRWLMYYLLYL